MLKKVDLSKPRVCKYCGETYMPERPIKFCNTCRNKKANERRIRDKEMGKLPADKPNYPFSTRNNDAIKRFAQIKKRLDKAWEEGPEAVKAHYDRQLKEAEEFGILEWIYDRRTTESKKEGKGRPFQDIRKELPSTMHMPYDI